MVTTNNLYNSLLYLDQDKKIVTYFSFLDISFLLQNLLNAIEEFGMEKFGSLFFDNYSRAVRQEKREILRIVTWLLEFHVHFVSLQTFEEEKEETPCLPTFSVIFI